jgi:3-oxoacyl-[acyl-carrier protein] reductase
MNGKVLAGKVALITGGARGLGREMALAFAEAGAEAVAITAAPGTDETSSIIEQELADTRTAIEAAGGRCLVALSDVATPADCKRTVSDTLAAFGRLHILVNNAGKAGRYAHGGKGSTPIYEADPEGFRAIIDTNVLGPYLMAWAATEHLIASGAGRIINISKRTDSMHQAAITPYGPSKAALEAATIAWAGALIDTGVTVNSLSPGGAINTKFGTGRIPNRGADPAVIRQPAVFLASDAGAIYTGCRFVADRWDDTRTLAEAAEAAREPAIFPKPQKETKVPRAWS